MGEAAGTSRRQVEPSFDEQFERLFDDAPEPITRIAHEQVPVAGGAKPTVARVVVRAALGLLLGVLVAVLFLALAAVVFALRPR